MKLLYTFLLSSFLATGASEAQSISKSEGGAYFSDFYVIEVKPMQFEITYKFPKNDRVLVKIKDQEENILFIENKLVYKKYHKYFDLTTMNDGRFTFELIDGDDRFVQSFIVATKTERVATAL
jgi:hypothetical protein